MFWKTTLGKVLGIILGATAIAAASYQKAHYSQSVLDHNRLEELSEESSLFLDMGREFLDHQHTIMSQVLTIPGKAHTKHVGSETPFSLGVHINEFVFPRVRVGDHLTIVILDNSGITIEAVVTGTFTHPDMGDRLAVLGKDVQNRLGVPLSRESVNVLVMPHDRYHDETLGERLLSEGN